MKNCNKPLRRPGGLEPSYDSIVADLDQARREGEATDRQLLQRKRELAASAAIAEATSMGRLDLTHTLERALQVILDLTGLPAGWIMLVPEDGGDPVMTGSVGLPPDVAKKQAAFRSSECQCAKALESGRALVVYPLHTGCPIRALDLGNGRLPVCHATVPLLTRRKVLGVLNLASDDPVSLDEQELTLLGAIGWQLGVAIENARLWEELKKRDAVLSQLLEQAITAQEDERRRIARELHDQIGQELTSILVLLRALDSEADGAKAVSAEGIVISPAHLHELKAIVANTLDGVRELAVELRPSVLDDLGLVPALQRYVRTCCDRHDLKIDFQTVGLEAVRLPPSVETALYRIAQEALSNIIQHACASEVNLLLTARDYTVVLIVEDNGCGFEVGNLMHGGVDDRWLGLAGMRERAELLGGKLSIESASGVGTTVFVELPLENGTGVKA